MTTRKNRAQELEYLKLRKIEGELRTHAIALWASTVDDPETATVESEAAGVLSVTTVAVINVLQHAADSIDCILRGES